MLGAAANGLHRGPHVFLGIHQVPARGQEFAAFDAAAGIDSFGLAGEAIGDDLAPGEIAVACDHGVRFAALECLFRKEGGVNAAVDDPGAAAARHAADRISAQSIAGVHADANDVAGLDGLGHDLLERFIDEDGIADRPGVAAASTKSQRGVMTAVPKELSLGLTR